ncbi:FUSC family protein [Clostridium sp. LIBA-8841]|uniref:FUSC family protein n=1 Tax=Clostridium sp. LIBA-8841 TaxID=2987530 RepID=UPI002AC3BFCC|nr:FUSC family protein [Clostridium sp. LIBA-8841]MDZ5254575.1 FUSC family protein [Clostridium sp. LIBA-8841]
MSKKAIISNTVIFVFIVAFIIAFKSIFGDDNTLIGVTTATAMLMMLQKDLTLSPLKNTLLLIVLNLFIGAAATLAGMNMWLGIPINFIAMFILSYSLCYNLKNPMYLPFSLQYLFILVTPVTPDKLPMRFISLISGAVIIMIVQLIANRNNVQKKGNKLLIKTCNDIIEKIKNLNINEDTTSLDNNIRNSLNNFRTIIYNKREERFYLTEESKIKLNISVALEKTYLLLNELDCSQHKDLVSVLENSLTEIKVFLSNESTINDDVLSKIKHYKGESIENLTVLKILSNLAFIYESLVKLKELGTKKYNLINKLDEIPHNFKTIYIMQSNFKTRSAKFSYAIRISIGISLAAFIMDYFHLAEGRWLVFTILSLVNPIYEVSKTKTKDRIFATIIGAIIVEILFFAFKGVLARTLILMLAGYISGFIKDYKYNMICVTVSAIGAASLLGNMGFTSTMVINRLLFVALGAVLAISINKFILPYNLNKDISILKKMYVDVVQEMLTTLEEVYIHKSSTKMNNLFIVTSFIEERLKANNIQEDDNLNQLITNERMLICSIYELYIQLSNYSCENQHLKNVFNNLKEEKSNKKCELKLKDYIHDSHSLEEKLLLSNVIEISNSINSLKTLLA